LFVLAIAGPAWAADAPMTTTATPPAATPAPVNPAAANPAAANPAAANPTAANPTAANPTAANPAAANPTAANPTAANPTAANPTAATPAPKEPSYPKTPYPTTSTPAETTAACARWTGLKTHPRIVSFTRRALGRRCVERLVIRSAARGRDVPVDVVLPDADPATVGRLPTLTLLGGLAGAVQPPEHSVNYWTVLVKLQRSLELLDDPNIGPRLAAGMHPEQRAAIESWFQRPVRTKPAIFLLPHTETSPANPRMHDYLGREFVEVIDARYPTRAERAGRGIDGICFGGVEALLTGLEYPATFGMTGVMQATMELDDTLRAGFKKARTATANPPHVHLVTSDRDIYHSRILALTEWMKTEYPDHELHDYVGSHAFSFYENVGGPLTILRYLIWFDSGDTSPPWDTAPRGG
jgi:hypothetical protein